MKIGNLVCFNAAGQRQKTLGIIVDITKRRAIYGDKGPVYLILWSQYGDYMPKIFYPMHNTVTRCEAPGIPYWFQNDHGCIEVINESR